jgi:signal peptidase II
MSLTRSLFSRPRFAMALVAVLVALDQLVKWAVEQYLPFQEQVEVLPVLALFRTHNEGIAFSMLTGVGDKWLLALTLLVIAFVAFLWARSTPGRWVSQIGFALVVAGAVGNLIDRAMLGYVIDYLLFHAGNWYFAVFNLADALISIGAAAIIIDELFGRWLYPKEQNETS